MRTFTLKPGLFVLVEDHHYRLMFFNQKGDCVFQDENGETWCVSRREFLQRYDAREVTIGKDQPYLATLPVRRIASPSLDCYPDAHAEEARRRHRYLQIFLEAGRSLPSEPELKERIKAIHDELQDALPCPSMSSIRRWWRAFLRSGCIVDLLPGHRHKGRHPVISGDLEAVVDEVVQLWMKRESMPIQQVYLELTQRVREINDRLPPSRQLSCPSRSTVYRYIEGLDPEVVSLAKKGKYATARDFRSVKGTVNARQINNRWEIDHTELDVLLVDPETGAVIGRPWLTSALDRESRMIVGFILHLLPPNLETVLHVLEVSIRPKGEIVTRFGLRSDWPCHGLPMCIVPDNAAEFHAGSLVKALADLGIAVLFPPSRTPTHKGGVERSFSTMAVDFVHTLPGTTFSNPRQRDDYPSEARACFTLSDLERELTRWIVDVYHRRPHRGMGKTSPLERWKALQSTRPLHLPADLDDLEAHLSCRVERTIHHYGVEVDGIRYNSGELQRIFHRPKQQPRIEVRIRDELGHVWVKDMAEELILLVPAIDERFKGLSRDLYKAARQEASKHGNKDDSFDCIIAAYRRIRAEVEQLKHAQQMRQRRHAAAVPLNRAGQVRPEIDLPQAIAPLPVPPLGLANVDVPVFAVTPLHP